jgi:hypothetical protein
LYQILKKINKVFNYDLFGSGEWRLWDFVNKYPFLRRFNRYKLRIEALDKRYQDPGDLVLDASFQVLINFREENWFNHIDWHSDEYHADIYNKTTHLYNWYKYKRPARYEPTYTGESPDILNNMRFSSDDNELEWEIYSELCTKFEEFYFQEDQTMLQLLVSIRRGMWT